MTATAWQEHLPPDTSASARARWHWDLATPAQLTAARRALGGALGIGASWAPGIRDVDVVCLLLAFEELASNGLRHGGLPVTVEVVATGSGWLVDVTDGRTDLAPAPAVGRDPALGGLGLHLVARLASCHGWAVVGSGKHVWACLTPRGG